MSLESEHPLADYETVRAELATFEDGALAKKPELLILTKSDTKDQKDIEQVAQLFAARGLRTVTVSVLDDAAVKSLRDAISSALG